MKPTYITPMFKQYTRQIRSERYPVLNMIFGKILETGDIGIPVSRDWCINDQQRANEYLSSHSLETALNDPCLKREVLLLKANGLKSYIGTQIPEEDFRTFVNDFAVKYRFRNIPFERSKQELSEKFPISLDSFLENWYHCDRMPHLIFKDGTLFKMTGCEEEKYQMRLKIYNPSEVHAFISVTLYDYGKKNDKNYYNYLIPAGEARELKFITYGKFASVWIKGIMENIPSGYYFSQSTSQVVQETEDGSEGIFPIDPELPASEPGVIIVDNEDQEVRTVDEEKKQRLKDIFREEADGKYQVINRFQPHERWTLTASESSCGEIVRSSVYKKSGNGKAYAEWKARISGKGYYEIAVWSTRLGSMGAGSFTILKGGTVKEESREEDRTCVVSYGEE